MEDKNFLEKNKTLLTLFGFSAILLMLFSAISGRGLFFDIPSMFLSVIEKQVNTSKFYYFFNSFAPENFSNRLLALPYNILTPMFSENPLQKLNLYTFSCLLTTFLATIFNFVIAKRTKRFEIASLALLVYALFAIPASCYPTNTTFLSIPIFFILLQYFWTEEKLYKADYLLIILISAYMFLSSANMLIPCTLMFLTGIIFLFKKHKRHGKVKMYIALTSLMSALFLLYRIFFLVDSDGNTFTNMTRLYRDYRMAFENVFGTFCSNEMIFSTIALLFLAYAVLSKKYLGKTDGILATVITAFALYSIYEFTKFAPNPFVNTHFFAVTLIIFLVIILGINTIFLAGKKFNSEKLSNNIIKTACICGIVQCIIQYGNCLSAFEYKNYLSDKINNAKGFISIKSEDYENKKFLAFDSCEQVMIRSLFLSDKNIKALIIPNEDKIKENKSCLGYNETEHAYDKNHSYIIIQSMYFPTKNKYWDFNEIIPLLNNLK